MGKSEGNRSLGRPRHKWEDNIKMDLRETGSEPGVWIDFAKDRDQWQAYVRPVMNLCFFKSQLVTCILYDFKHSLQ